MKRRALIIGSPFPIYSPNYLPGVQSDIRQMISFLKSDIGGGWHREEIIYLHSPSARKLNSFNPYLIGIDLLFVYFSGHGNQSYGADQIYINSQESYPLSLLWKNVPRQIIITDACRTEVGYESFRGLGDIMGSFPNKDKQLARELYESYVMNSPAGQFLFQSCGKNQASTDTSEGGLFTKSLISTLQTWAWSEESYALSLQSLVNKIPSRLQEGRKPQNPTAKFRNQQFLEAPIAVNPALYREHFIPKRNPVYYRAQPQFSNFVF